jgi:predicted nucleic acid-binding Zn ribbon protein
MRQSNTQSIASVIQQMIKEYGIGDKLLQARLPAVWKNLMGSAIARRTLDIALVRGVLTLRLSSAPLKQDLQFQKDVIRQRMNEALGEDVIQEVCIL